MTPIHRAIDAAGGPSRLARELGVTAQAVRFWRDGLRAIPERHGAEIERACGGVVTRRELWPTSWMRIWPELVEAQSLFGDEPIAPAFANAADDFTTPALDIEEGA